MENSRNSYRERIKEYVCSLDIDSAKKRQLYIALNGGIYGSLKEKKGKGTKTMYFEDGTKQRVDTYEGRFKAISKILGEDLETSELLYRRISAGKYGNNARENLLQDKAVQKYLELKGFGEAKKNTLEDAVIAEREAEPIVREETSPSDGYSGLEEGYVRSNSSPECSKFKGSKKSSLLRKIEKATKALAIGASLVLGVCYIGLQRSLSEMDGSNTEIIQRGDLPQRTYKEPTNGEATSKLPSEVSRPDVYHVEDPELPLEEFYGANLEMNGREGSIVKTSENMKGSTSEVPSMGRGFSGLDFFLTEGYKDTEKFGGGMVPTEQVAANQNDSEITTPEEETFSSPEIVENVTSKKFGVSSDIKKYLDHTTQRNAQIVEGDLSVNPLHLVKQTGYNFVPFAEEVTDCSSLGYSKEDFSNRSNGVKFGLKKLGNGLQKLVSLGFWDSRKDEDKAREGNQVLRFLKSPYDIVLGTIQSTVNSADYVSGGVLGKTVNTAVDATRGVVGTAVSATNYAGAVPFYPLDRAEELLHEGNCSQKVYETVFSLARFGGNVLSHEVPQNGKSIEIISNDGKKVVLDKGEIGATLELATALGLDSFAISKLLDGSNGSGSSNNNGGENPSNGGIVIIPGNGGSVGGGM